MPKERKTTICEATAHGCRLACVRKRRGYLEVWKRFVTFAAEKRLSMTTRREKSKPQKPQMNKQLEAMTENQKPKSDQSIALEAGKFCLDIAKLVFGGVILAGIMQQGIEFNSLFLTGLSVVLLFVIFGFYLIKKSKQRK